MPDPLPDNLRQKDKLESTNQQSKVFSLIKKPIFLSVCAVVMIVLTISVFIVNRSRNTETFVNNPTANKLITNNNDQDIRNENKPTDSGNNVTNEEDDGIDESGFDPKLPKISEDEDAIEINVEDNSNKPVYLTGPNIIKNATQTDFVYDVNFTDIALSTFNDGFSYEINRHDCTIEDAILSNTSFEGAFYENINNDITIPISIDNLFLDEETPLVQSTYTLYDTGGSIIVKGKIQSPGCVGINESNENGRFKIKTPLINTEMLEGVHHFDYEFSYDEKAKAVLENGFIYNVFASKCLGDGISENDNYFEGQLPPGEMNIIGFSVNIKSSSLPTEPENLFAVSRYRIEALNGTELFSGYTSVPNCY